MLYSVKNDLNFYTGFGVSCVLKDLCVWCMWCVCWGVVQFTVYITRSEDRPPWVSVLAIHLVGDRVSPVIHSCIGQINWPMFFQGFSCLYHSSPAGTLGYRHLCYCVQLLCGLWNFVHWAIFRGFMCVLKVAYLYWDKVIKETNSRQRSERCVHRA